MTTSGVLDKQMPDTVLGLPHHGKKFGGTGEDGGEYGNSSFL
jgi:hypothetical protein